MKNLLRNTNSYSKIVSFSNTFFLVLTLVCINIFSSEAQTYPLDDPAALEGQVIVDPQNAAWLKYNGGKHIFICGAGDPENFLYRGTRLADGTREGDQMQIIEKMKGTGANSIHVIAFRSGKYGGDGADDHNPFVDSDISKNLDENILNQWEKWFTELDKNGILIYFFIYDDEIKLKDAMKWDLLANGDLPAQEQYFVTTLVNRFKHHNNLVWITMEGTSKIYGHETHLRKVAEVIKKTDNHHHPVGMSENNKLDFYEYANNEYVDFFSLIYYSTDTPLKIHNMLLEAKYIARNRYCIFYTESMKYGKGAVMRQKNWAAAMAGTYVMVYQMDVATTDISDLQDCGRLKNYFESIEFYNMSSNDGMALGDTEYVLATNQNISSSAYVAYSSKASKSLGLKNVQKGRYNLTWFDCISGETIKEQNVLVAEGKNSWEKPSTIGLEVTLYLKRVLM